MSNTLLNISGKIPSDAVYVYHSVNEVARQLGIPFVVVGASARDIVLHYGYGAPIQRATRDIDVGIQVPNWNAFHTLKQNLLSRDFKETRQQQQLMSASGVPVDIIPFGQVEDDESNIFWPPNGDWVMNVLGFQEACDTAELVCMQEAPFVTIPVATPVGMTVLKLIAWADRTPDMRTKDAKDLLYLITTYQNIPTVNDQIYDEQQLMERYDWDIELAGAHRLGIDTRATTKAKTFEAIEALFAGNSEKLSVEILVREMGERNDDKYERNTILTQAFIAGFLDK